MSSPLTQDLADKIRRHLAHKNGASLRRLLARHNFADIAEVMETKLTNDEAVKAFQYLNIGQAAQVLTSLSDDRQQSCLSSLPTVMGSLIIRSMAVDDAVDILQEMDLQQSRRLIDELPLDSDTRALQNLLLEEPDTAAGLMSTDYIAVPVDGTVGDAMALIRQAEEKDFIYYCYLIDDEEKLIGAVSLKTLILHDEAVALNKIAHFDMKSLLINYDQELVANIFRKYYNLLAMPVVDADNQLCGVITLDDIVDVIDEETSEDVYRASGISLEDMDEKNLIVGPVINAFKARFPWLSITMVGQLLASGIIAHFDKTVSTAVIAVSFMPLLTGLSGNMGTQTETITVRGMSQGLITDDNIKEKYIRELRLAIMTGGSFAVSVGFLSYLFYKKLPLSLLLAAWILISLCISASMGMLLPYLFKRIFKVDPAGMGGPVITTLSDILTFTIYLSVITLLLHQMV